MGPAHTDDAQARTITTTVHYSTQIFPNTVQSYYRASSDACSDKRSHKQALLGAALGAAALGACGLVERNTARRRRQGCIGGLRAVCHPEMPFLRRDGVVADVGDGAQLLEPQ